MRWPGAGRLGLAVAAALAVLAAATAGQASNKEDANSARPESESATRRDGHEPETSSVRAISPSDLFPTAEIRVDPTYPSVAAPTSDEKLLVELINVERTSRGLRPVAWDGMLSQIARVHGADMRDVRHASHDSSKDGATYSTRLARTPYRASAAAENVAYNSNVVRAHRALMDSPGHRRNILDPNLSAVGIGVLRENGSGEWVYVVEDFATPITALSDEEAERRMKDALVRAGTGWTDWSLPEDKAMSRRLDEMLQKMVRSGTVRDAVGGGVGVGWTLAFTSLDPSTPPKSALDKVKKAEGYALAVTFAKSKKYPFGAYWGILYLKGNF